MAFLPTYILAKKRSIPPIPVVITIIIHEFLFDKSLDPQCPAPVQSYSHPIIPFLLHYSHLYIAPLAILVGSTKKGGCYRLRTNPIHG